MVMKAVVVNDKDNVATCVKQLKKSEIVSLQMPSYLVDVVLVEDIPFGHKFALEDLEKADSVVKYGEIIGLATRRIVKGAHVHVHNVESRKARSYK